MRRYDKIQLECMIYFIAIERKYAISETIRKVYIQSDHENCSLSHKRWELSSYGFGIFSTETADEKTKSQRFNGRNVFFTAKTSAGIFAWIIAIGLFLTFY